MLILCYNNLSDFPTLWLSLVPVADETIFILIAGEIIMCAYLKGVAHVTMQNHYSASSPSFYRELQHLQTMYASNACGYTVLFVQEGIVLRLWQQRSLAPFPTTVSFLALKTLWYLLSSKCHKDKKLVDILNQLTAKEKERTHLKVGPRLKWVSHVTRQNIWFPNER